MKTPTKKNIGNKPDDIKLEKINVFFKKSILKSLMKILTMEHTAYRNHKSIKNINKLFTNLDMSKYKNNLEIEAYIWCISFISKQWLEGIVTADLILEVAKRHPEFNDLKGEIIVNAISDKEVISPPEVKMIFDLIGEALQYGYITSMKDEYINLLEEINLEDIGASKKLSERLFAISQSLLDIKHNTNLVTNKIVFNTSDPNSIREAVDYTISALQSSSNIFKTGIKRLNTLLSPGYMNGRIYIYLGLPSSGKAQPHDTLIPTPNGLTPLGYLQVGDEVFNIDGKITKIKQIHYQGMQPTYEIKFSDGRSTCCNPEHLWNLRKIKVDGSFENVTLTLKEILDNQDEVNPNQYFLPETNIMEYPYKETKFSPWLYGYLFQSLSNSNIDGFIKGDDELNYRFLKEFLKNADIKQIGTKFNLSIDTQELQYTISNIIRGYDIFRENQLVTSDEYSHEEKIKFVKDPYIENSMEVRWEVLRGILDFAGFFKILYQEDTPVHFHLLCRVCNNRIVKYVRRLLSSMNIAFAQIDDATIKISTHGYSLNQFFSSTNAIMQVNGLQPAPSDENLKYVNIRQINHLPDTEQSCITIEDDRHIYLTEENIPTHNSLMLLKSALDISKYNPDYVAKTPGMRPCVLYITMENTFSETIERIWNMTFDDSITNYSTDEAVSKLTKELGMGIKQCEKKPEGGLKDLASLLTEKKNEESSIDLVIMYFSYREIATDDLQTIIQDLKEVNQEVCALVLDYVKRIRPSVQVVDNVRLELDRIVNELKSLAVKFNIPLITAHQMNRAAAATVDEAVRRGKVDVSKLVGRENVGDSLVQWGTPL